MKSNSFLSQRMAKRVSAQCRRMANPEPADRDAAIYDQTWGTVTNPATIAFFVLAFDAEEALELGRLRVESFPRKVIGLRNVSSVRRAVLTEDTLLAALRVEGEAETECREDHYRQRHQDPAELTGANAVDAVQDAFDKLMRRG